MIGTVNAAEPEPPEIVIEPAQMAGVWSNLALVSHSVHEFTIDFIRMDSLAPGRGIVVARVALSPSLVTQLVDQLNADLSEYARETLPKEIYGPEAEIEDNGQET